MKKLGKLSAGTLLKIKYPCDLYKKDKLKEQFRVLSKKWYPDFNPKNKVKANEVFIHIKSLYEKGLNDINNSMWGLKSNLATFTDKLKSERKYKIRYKICHEFELGKIYVGSSSVVYLLNDKYTRLSSNGVLALRTMKFPDGKKDEFLKYIPNTPTRVGTTDGTLIIYKKQASELLLKDVLEHYKGVLHPRSICWIISSILNTLCLLQYSNVVLNNISPTSLFISPSKHYVVLHGWWYSVKAGKKLIGLPKRTIDFTSAISSKNSARILTDIELLKTLGKELLGDIYGSKLLTNKKIPKPIL